MTPGFQSIINDARKQGCEVIDEGNRTLIVARRHRRTGKILTGLLMYPNGWAVDPNTDPSVSIAINKLDTIRKTLGLIETNQPTAN